MSLKYPDHKCPRGLDTCRSYGQIVSDDDNPSEGSFFCCGRNDGTLAPVKDDIYTLCFHGEFRDAMDFYDRRDLVDQTNVITSALSHIELDMMQDIERKG